MRLYNEDAAEKSGLVYNMIGRIFGNGTHYKARFQTIAAAPPNQQGVYDYDGMLFQGVPKKLKQGTINSCLVGPDRKIRDLPTGFATHAVVYLLAGGRNAQHEIYRSQCEAIDKKHSVSASIPKLDTIPQLKYTGTEFINVLDTWSKHPNQVDFLHYESVVPLRPVPDLDEPESEETDEERRKRDRGDEPVTRQTRQKTKKVAQEASKAKNKKKADPKPAQKATKGATRGKRKNTRPKKRETPDHPPSSNAENTEVDIKDFLGNVLSSPTAAKTILQSSPVDADFEMFCRCGTRGNGDRDPVYQVAIQCDKCRNWSHISCQRGLAGKDKVPKQFVCHWCNPSNDRKLM
jgi:hypothetical protein